MPGIKLFIGYNLILTLAGSFYEVVALLAITIATEAHCFIKNVDISLTLIFMYLFLDT